jgi:hypothetical protein
MRTRSPWFIALALACPLAASPAPTPAPADGPACQGTLRGAVAGTFRCTVAARDGADGQLSIEFTALDLPGGAMTLAPGGFQLEPPLGPRTWSLAEMAAARVTVTASDGSLYSATRTSRSRGEVTLALREASRLAGSAGAWKVRGTLRAVLRPSGSPRTDEVVVELSF